MRSSSKARGSAKDRVSKTTAKKAASPGAKTATGRKPHKRAPCVPRSSLYEEVTDKIVAELAAGRAPWVRPWGKVSGAAPGLPSNLVTGRAYSGVNILLLWGALIERGYRDQRWLTYRQAEMAGGQVRKGEEGVTVVYADRFTPKAEAERAAVAGEEPGAVPFLKRFKLFNITQCDGLDAFAAAPSPPPEREIVPHVEALIVATGADFRIGGDEAFYSPMFDYVKVPPQPAFRHQIDYYRTALHELSHWTGHPTRLARDQTGPFGSKPYGFEELVAELSAAFCCAGLSIAPTVRQADYIGAWLDILREDNRAIFRAASKASKAADFLLAYDPRPGAERQGRGVAGADVGASAEARP